MVYPSVVLNTEFQVARCQVSHNRNRLQWESIIPLKKKKDA